MHTLVAGSAECRSWRCFRSQESLQLVRHEGRKDTEEGADSDDEGADDDDDDNDDNDDEDEVSATTEELLKACACACSL